MKASEHLAAARDEIEKGWTTGTLQDHVGNVCAVGAINRVANEAKPQGLDAFVNTCTAGNSAAAALEKVVQELGGHGIMGFNDSSTKQDVLNAFDKAIGQLEERGE